MSSDPIYISDEGSNSDDEDDKEGVQALEDSQIPDGMRKRSNRDNPFVLSDDEDSAPSSFRRSARATIAPHPFFTSSQENALPGPSSAASTSSSVFGSGASQRQSISPEVDALVRAGLKLPATLQSSRTAVPQTWYDNEVRQQVNASGAVQPKFNTSPSLIRLTDAARSSPKAEIQYLYERSLMIRLQRQHKK
jgi:hypothetical protein